LIAAVEAGILPLNMAIEIARSSDEDVQHALTQAYASAILAGTPQAQLVTAQTPKRLKGMTAEAIARMERELSRLQEAISSIQDSYGQDHLHLTVVKGYLRKLITNDRVARYLAQYQPELLIEFQKIAEMTSTLPSEAA
jgi:hypothetical protein